MTSAQQIVAIGSFAATALAVDQSARVAGVTSRGLFLQLDRGGLVFISSEAQRGPLTLNLPTGTDLPDVAAGSAARVHGGSRLVLSGRRALEFRAAQVWSPAPPFGTPNGCAVIKRTIKSILRECLSARRATRYLQWLEAALNQPVEAPQPQVAAMRGLAQALAANGSLLDAARPFLGAGSGLTPAGDDLLAGALLALSRWGGALFPALILPDTAPLLALAGEKTTTLSAALLVCATAGHADERLVDALDGVVTGTPDASACARLLLSWGSTSGVEAFAGMALLLAR